MSEADLLHDGRCLVLRDPSHPPSVLNCLREDNLFAREDLVDLLSEGEQVLAFDR